ncbi:Eco57I restriction-modification methylase domain-containing protein [Bradyrhizobium sp. HKCCYLS2038]|uniref:Eco57I restriction-modification methylase domain-containing protein n=1 Tax=unclassified Bradyrhizobium TaxID=2631580 RepID=UPI003EBDDF92
MPAPSIVSELVQRYKDNRSDYISDNYKEFRLRREFIDPLFEALGWDVSNRAGYAEAYKDVIHEDTIKIGTASKAPDYAFRIGGTRKFFVETKAPGLNLKQNVEPPYQLRRYGWSAKLPLSVLTDFEEFAVYDCRVRPTPSDKASVARTNLIRFDEYEDRWSEIEGIFGREAVLKGSFDRYADDTTRKRGTAEVDTAFLQEIEEWRSILAKNIALRNPGLSVRDLNTAVQRTIDRIIFLRIAEDRGIEPYGRLRELIKGADAYKRLTQLFRQADDRYNSGLFHFKAEPGATEPLDKFTLGLKIEDKPLRQVFASLYYPESPYEFSVLPADILGQVYEQFLGKVIRLRGRSAVVEEKPEVKKAGGVFYTPTFVVRHIIDKVLAPLLQGKSPSMLMAGGKTGKSDRQLRILDPACGSGSFLIEVYQHLLDWHRDWYVANGAEKHGKGKNATLYKADNGEWRLTIAEKRRILLAHIYGVDIDPQAVEVTKLSLLLKVLENEKADVIAAQMNFFHLRALPDLGGNIKCGNSLVEHDFFTVAQTTLFAEVDPVKTNAFDWKRELPFKFDAVVGNPPYGADYSDAEKEYFQGKFAYRKGKPETYLFFIEQGLSLLKAGGVLGYIVPNAWLTNFYGLQMRTKLLETASIREISDLEPVKVFKKATVDTCIVIVQNVAPKRDSKTDISRVSYDRVISHEFSLSQSAWLADPERIYNVYADERDLTIMLAMESSKQRLEQVLEFSQGVIPYLTKADGEKNLYIGPSKKTLDWKPLIESASQVAPYFVAPTTSYIHYGRWLNRARESRFFEQPKILFHRLRKKLPRQLVGAIDETGLVNRHALSNLVLLPGQDSEVLWAVLALFNSDIANWWFVKRYGPLMEVGGFKVQTIPLPSNWRAAWKSLAREAHNVADAATKARLSLDEHVSEVHSRSLGNSKAQIEKTVAEAYGLSQDDLTHIERSYKELLARAKRPTDEGKDDDEIELEEA